jgi:hypothetical protein
MAGKVQMNLESARNKQIDRTLRISHLFPATLQSTLSAHNTYRPKKRRNEESLHLT